MFWVNFWLPDPPKILTSPALLEKPDYTLDTFVSTREYIFNMNAIKLEKIKLSITDACEGTCAYCYRGPIRGNTHINYDQICGLIEFASRHASKLHILTFPLHLDRFVRDNSTALSHLFFK